MSPRKPTLSPLAARLAELSIEPHELAALCRVELSTVEEDWIDAAELPDDAKVLTRFLVSDEDALRRVDQLRRTYTKSMRGEGAENASAASPPYGTFDAGKLDGQPVPTMPPLRAPTQKTREAVQDGKLDAGAPA